ncbi:sugar-binding transcriptional regulator [Lichenihabitans sp. Uapishka_5]|uniref:sugar-binding transcriptional regulator n=1 Tax=Lichenihabitans sp. Uapishka_5 TaxID=3037302 RepID=UPI0029E7F6AF|nr:sugar-binding transcriptional regulator [Lichenihabitans sp. Uapishka_5]MDX7950690.1 sugar-binding transcriptional regulator [Lichenihabitans sp. Uapishka_5]
MFVIAVSILPDDDEDSLSARAAWLHFVGGLTQGEVAGRLNVPAGKAHRLIARANRAGLVQVFIDGTIGSCVALEEQLRDRFGLSHCEVAPDLNEGPLPLRALGTVGARFLRQACEGGAESVIGLGHGRTLASCVSRLPRASYPEIKFVSLLGGFTRKFAANPFDVINLIADRAGVEAYVMPVPFCLNSAEDRAVLLAQRGIDEVYDLARRASLRIVGIGTVLGQDASLAASHMIEPAELAEIQQAGGCGEVLGHFFDARGRRIETELSSRLMSLDIEELRTGKMVAVAGGALKPAAIRAVLESRLLHGLLTDERTARALVDLPGPG